ncbi:MAG: transposase [Deinococcales bacterium]
MIEALNLKGLASGFLAKSFRDVAIGKFQQLLEYKAGYAGKQVLKVDPRYTTQDCCPSCGYRDGKKPLSVRTWTCSKCKATHDRHQCSDKHIGTVRAIKRRHEPRGWVA